MIGTDQRSSAGTVDARPWSCGVRVGKQSVNLAQWHTTTTVTHLTENMQDADVLNTHRTLILVAFGEQFGLNVHIYLDCQIFSSQSDLCVDGRILHGISI